MTRLTSQAYKLRIFLLLLILVFSSYGNALFNKFVVDDGYLIVENPYIKHLKFLPNLFSGDLVASTTNAHNPSGYYRPLSMLSFMVDYQIWRLNPLGFHLTNILIHFLNCLLVFLILFEVSQNQKVSLLTSALFAVYPIHVEAVTPVYNRMGIQVALFMLASFLLFMKSKGCERKSFLFGALILFFLALLSKEEALTLPLLFFCFDYFYFSNRRIKGLLERKKIIFYGLCALVALAFLCIRQANIGRQISFPYFSPERNIMPALADNLFLHLLTVVKIIGACILKAIWPFSLSATYWIDPVKDILDPQVMGSALLLVVLLYLALFLRNRRRDISFAIFAFFISIVIFSNIVPLGESYTFRERFFYIASVWVCFIWALGISALLDYLAMIGNLKKILSIIPISLVLSFGILTAIANYTWRTNFTLWRDTVQRCPLSQEAHMNLAEAYSQEGKYLEAIVEYEKSLTMPKLKALNSVYLTKLNLTKIYTETGQYDKAAVEIQEALVIAQKLRINAFGAYDKLGLLYVRLKNEVQAEDNFKKALKFNPNYVPSKYNLGVLYFEKKDYNRALKQFEAVISLDPDFILAKLALGLTYRAKGDVGQAREVFEKILKANPEFLIAKQYLNMLNKGK